MVSTPGFNSEMVNSSPSVPGRSPQRVYDEAFLKAVYGDRAARDMLSRSDGGRTRLLGMTSPYAGPNRRKAQQQKPDVYDKRGVGVPAMPGGADYTVPEGRSSSSFWQQGQRLSASSASSQFATTSSQANPDLRLLKKWSRLQQEGSAPDALSHSGGTSSVNRSRFFGGASRVPEKRFDDPLRNSRGSASGSEAQRRRNRSSDG